MGLPVSSFHVSTGLWAMGGAFPPPLVPPIPGMPYGYYPAFPFPTPSRSATSPSPANHVTESDLQVMLKRHRKRRLENDVSLFLYLICCPFI